MKLDASHEFDILKRVIENITMSADLIGDQEVIVDLTALLLTKVSELTKRAEFDDVEAFLRDYGFVPLPPKLESSGD